MTLHFDRSCVHSCFLLSIFFRFLIILIPFTIFFFQNLSNDEFINNSSLISHYKRNEKYVHIS